MTRIGVITMGQTPRDDGLTSEIAEILGKGFSVVETGVLDRLSPSQIETLAPAQGDYVLVTRLRNGSWVRLAKKAVLPLMQERVDEMNRVDAEAIVLLCTGAFPAFRSKKALVVPQPILYHLVKGIAGAGTRRVGVMAPLPEQVEQARSKWGEIGVNVVVSHANPYGDVSAIGRAAAELVSQQAELLVMDCFGYSLAMKEAAKRSAGRPVVLARSVIARVVGELAA